MPKRGGKIVAAAGQHARKCEWCNSRFVQKNLWNPGRFCSVPCANAAASKPLTHGDTVGGQTTEYTSWENMIGRCGNPRNRFYKWYGGRGIAVCTRWRRSYPNFLADMGRKPTPRHTLDRFPNRNGNYEPGNCRWATRAEQIDNRDVTKRFTVDGITDTLRGWSTRLGVKYSTLACRVERGWLPERALTEPCHEKMTGVTKDKYTLNGVTMDMNGWSKKTGLSVATLRCRLARGWPLKKALTAPRDGRGGDRT